MSKDDNRPTAVRSVESINRERPEGDQERKLLVVIGELVNSHPLPRQGELSVGRLDESDIVIDDSTISRRHAKITVGTRITIEDCESLNGVRVGGRKLAVGEQAEVLPGVIVELGDAMILVQRKPAPRRQKRAMSRAEFEKRLFQESDRAGKTHTAFAVLAVELDEAVPEEAFENAVQWALRTEDLVASAGKRNYSCLLPDTTPAMAETLSRALVRSTGTYHTGVRVGIACSPRDGHEPAELLERARESCGAMPPPRDPGVIVMEDEPLKQLHRLIERIAPGSINVIIRGETGVGKEVVARLIHQLSRRPPELFVSVNCAALPDNLLESELFGHERGAFTGATKTKPGLLEVARDGTFLLDEVSEMPLPLQAKLLRVIEQRQAVRIGGLKPYRIQARLIATTNRDLEEAVRQGTFRQDLLYRLDGISVFVPPLRERVKDIEPLAQLFIEQTFRELGRNQRPQLTQDAVDWLRGQPWPGNVRELRNAIERAALLCQEGRITSELLSSERTVPAPVEEKVAGEPTATLQIPRPPPRSLDHDAFAREPTRLKIPPLSSGGDMKQQVKQLEYQRVREALEQCGGNQTAAAKMLGISRRTLINRLEEFDILRPRKRPNKDEEP